MPITNAPDAPRKRRKRKKLALAEPREIKMAIYSLTTRGKHARSHIEQELREIIAAAKSQLADYQKGLQNRRRHGHRTEKDLAARKAWFDAKIAGKESYKASREFDEAVAARKACQPPVPPVPVKTLEQIAFEENMATYREIGIERGEKGWDDCEHDSLPAAAPAPARHTQAVQQRWTPPQTYEPAHEQQSGYDIYYARLAQQEAAETPKLAPSPAQPTEVDPDPEPPPGSAKRLGWLHRQIEKRKAARTSKSD